MPLRVKCRCGQEIIVRQSEWVYLLLGFAVTAALVNVVVLILTCLDIGGPSPSDGDDPPRIGASRDATDAGAEQAASGSGALSGAPSAAGSKRRQGPETSRREGSVAGPLGAAEPGGGEGPPPTSPSGSREAPGTTVPLEPPRLAAPPGMLAPESRDAARTTLIEQLERLVPPAAEETATAQSPRGAATRLVAPTPPLVRFALLGVARENTELCHAFLLDPDRRVRLLAMEQSLSEPRPRSEVASLVGSTVREARPLLEEEPGGRELLDRFGVGAGAPEGSGSETPLDPSVREEYWESVRQRVEELFTIHPELAPLRKSLETTADAGIDLLLAIDTTQSMETALDAVKETARWVLPALEWGVPGLRVGVLFYKDGVEEVVPLSSRPTEDILPRILASKAEGGDDPAEGLHVALRSALELGTVPWRPAASKHVVFVGDAPLPRAAKIEFETLAAAALDEARYRVHLLGVQPQEGRPEVPFFTELAEAGGGRAATCRAGSLGVELMACFLGSEAIDALKALAPGLRSTFSKLAG